MFKIAKNYQTDLTEVIGINYFAASIFGILLLNKGSAISDLIIFPQLHFAVLVGFLFISMFFLIGYSSQKAGIAVTTLANKLSVVFPVILSLLYFNEPITKTKVTGLILAIAAISLMVFKKNRQKSKTLTLLLPIFIFVGSGFTDSTLKYVQEIVLGKTDSAIFSTQVFIVSFLIAISILAFKKIEFKAPTLLIGILLGLVNFGSLYFLINALNKSGLGSSLVFIFINISIVLLSGIIGVAVFKEKLSKLNFTGLVLAIISLYFLIS